MCLYHITQRRYYSAYYGAGEVGYGDSLVERWYSRSMFVLLTHIGERMGDKSSEDTEWLSDEFCFSVLHIMSRIVTAVQESNPRSAPSLGPVPFGNA